MGRFSTFNSFSKINWGFIPTEAKYAGCIAQATMRPLKIAEWTECGALVGEPWGSNPHLRSKTHCQAATHVKPCWLFQMSALRKSKRPSD